MSYEKQIERLGAAWDAKTGFFWHVRQGVFDEQTFEETLKIVSSIPASEDDPLPRRLVSLLWYIPRFMEWQIERVRDRSGDVNAYQKATNRMASEVERILGTP